MDGFGPPLNYSPRHIYGQSKDGQKLIVKVGKHISCAISKLTEYPNRHYTVNAIIWSQTELEYKEARGKRLPTGNQQNSQRNYRNATIYPIMNPNSTEWLNLGDHIFGS
jgi:hypothetical protein